MSNELPNEVNKLLKSWKRQIDKNERLHRKRALWFRSAYYCLGVPATILAGLFTASSLATIPQCSTLLVLCIGQAVAGAITTTLIGIQTYMQLATRFMNNKLASDRYQALLRTIETILYTKSNMDPANILNYIQKSFDDIVTTSPILPVDDKKLKYAIFDRETRSRRSLPSHSKGSLPSSSNDIESGHKPASKEELEKENNNVDIKDVCIDVDLAEKLQNYIIDPELQYQMNRFNDQIKK